MLIFLELLEEEDQEPFLDIYQKNYLKMYHKAYTLLRHREDAENAVHESFVKLAERYQHYKHLNSEQMTALCITIVKNKSIDILRKNKYFSEIEIQEKMKQSVQKDILSVVIEKEDVKQFWEKYNMLSEPYKEVLELRYFVGLSTREVAKVLDISLRNADMRIQRAKRKLKEELNNEGRNI